MVVTPNDLLREARERVASSACPDECLSRQELAELVNAWIWKHHHKKVETSASYVGQLERGTIRWPGRLYREAFRAILGVPTDSALGFVNSRRAVVRLAGVDRRQFTHTGLGVGAMAALAGPLAAFLEGASEPTPVPARVGAAEIQQVRAAIRMFESWTDTYGGASVRDAGISQLRWSASLLDASCPDRLYPELCSAVGDLADCVGWMAVDAHAPAQAERVFHLGLACAEKADDWPLRGQLFSSLAQQAIRTGQPDHGVTLAEQGLIRPDRLTAAGRAALHTVRGRALARMRRVTETLSAVGAADEHFAHVTPANEPPCMAFYNRARHDLFAGRSLIDLAVLGHYPARMLTDRFAAAATAHHIAGNTRSHAVCLAKLASLTMATGDPLQAAGIGHEALDAADTIRSRQVSDDLVELARYAAPHQHLNEVAHLRRRITRLVPPESA